METRIAICLVPVLAALLRLTAIVGPNGRQMASLPSSDETSLRRLRTVPAF